MSKKISRIIATIMLILAVAYVVFALCHPQMSFPWSNGITYTLYGLYIILVAILFVAPFKRK